MNQQKYRLLQIVFILALLLISGGIVYWFFDADRSWGSLLMYLALLIVTASNFMIQRKNFQNKQ